MSFDHFTVRFTESKKAVVSCDQFTVCFTESKKDIVSYDEFRHGVLRCLQVRDGCGDTR